MAEKWVGANGVEWGRSTLAEIMAGVRPYTWEDKPRLVGRSTAGYWRNRDTYVVRLHRTDILVFTRPVWQRERGTIKVAGGTTVIETGKQWISEAETIEVDCGGWMTPTTKDRINTWLPSHSIYSYNGEWAIRSLPSDWWRGQPFTGQVTIVLGRLPVLEDWRNPIICSEMDKYINRFIKWLEGNDWMMVSGGGRNRLDSPWTPGNVQTWLTNGHPYASAFINKVMVESMARLGGKLFAARIGSKSQTVRAKLRRTVRDWLRREAGTAGPTEDLREIV